MWLNLFKTFYLRDSLRDNSQTNGTVVHYATENTFYLTWVNKLDMNNELNYTI